MKPLIQQPCRKCGKPELELVIVEKLHRGPQYWLICANCGQWHYDMHVPRGFKKKEA